MQKLELLLLCQYGLPLLLLAAGVRAVLEDPELEVVRIKNRLDPGDDSRLSGGYRDVAMNMRLVSERGVEGRVCELSLRLILK
eukprot:684325-Hanusia_phi.AAC.1